MDKKFYALKLIPSRPDFAQTMTEEERGIMMQHVNHWMDFMSKGHVTVFGPVFDPAGVYGFGVVQVDNEQQLQSFIQGDPAATINKYEYYPMQAIVPNP